MTKLHEKIAEILEVDEISASDPFEEFDNWDSLSIFSIIAHINTEYDIVISSEEIEAIRTVADLDTLVAAKSQKPVT